MQCVGFLNDLYNFVFLYVLFYFYYRLAIETMFRVRQVARGRHSNFLIWHFLEMEQVERRSNWCVHVSKKKNVQPLHNPYITMYDVGISD